MKNMWKYAPYGSESFSKLHSLYTEEVVKYLPGLNHPLHLKVLASESWNAAALDCDATKTVAGEVMYIYQSSCTSKYL